VIFSELIERQKNLNKDFSAEVSEFIIKDENGIA